MKIAHIAHVSVLVRDVPRALRFYQDLLGFSLCARPDLGYPGAWLYVSHEQQIHLLGLCEEREALSDRRPGHDRHVAFVVSGLALLRARLEEAGISTVGSRSGRPALFCRDPDGNALEFIEGGPDPDGTA